MSAEDLGAEALVEMATNTRNTNKPKGKKSVSENEASRGRKNLLLLAVVPLVRAVVPDGGSTACYGR